MEPDIMPMHIEAGMLQSKDHWDLLDIIDRLRSAYAPDLRQNSSCAAVRL